jgi:hypothetical protein
MPLHTDVGVASHAHPLPARPSSPPCRAQRLFSILKDYKLDVQLEGLAVTENISTCGIFQPQMRSSPATERGMSTSAPRPMNVMDHSSGLVWLGSANDEQQSATSMLCLAGKDFHSPRRLRLPHCCECFDMVLQCRSRIISSAPGSSI